MSDPHDPFDVHDPVINSPEPSGLVAPDPVVPHVPLTTVPPVLVKEPIIPVKKSTVPTPPVTPVVATKKVTVVNKEETNLECVTRILKEYDGIVSNIPVSHPTFWNAKNRLS